MLLIKLIHKNTLLLFKSSFFKSPKHIKIIKKITLSFLIESNISDCAGSFVRPKISWTCHLACISDTDKTPPLVANTKPRNPNDRPITGWNTCLNSFQNKNEITSNNYLKLLAWLLDAYVEVVFISVGENLLFQVGAEEIQIDFISGAEDDKVIFFAFVVLKSHQFSFNPLF